jgi:hypothetical protein
MATKNDITGDFLVSKPNSKQFEDNYDLIWGNKSPLCDICGKDLKATKECAWTSCPLNWDEKRADIIGQNGNVGYE